MKLTMLQGISGSGKTFFAKEQVKLGQGNTIIVCKDDLRNMLHNGDYSKGREAIVKLARNALITLALSEGKNVISADTNFDNNEQELCDVVNAFEKSSGKKVEFERKIFDTDLITCIARDAQRPNPLGEKIIRSQFNRWIKKPITVLEQDKSLKSGLIVDIDGTLAINNSGRSPYAWDLVKQDDVDPTVAQIVSDYYSLGTQIVLVSGRDSVCRELTEEWLEENNIPYNALFMREQDDNRKDVIIKEEIFWRDIFNKWNIKFVLDDRNCVVQDCWRKIGLKCLQVAEGDF